MASPMCSHFFQSRWCRCGCRCCIKLLLTIFLNDFFFIVPDPRKWSREEVREWLMWMSLRHKVPIDPARFQMNGKALCLMSLQMFAFRVPIGGKLLYKDFQLRLTSAFHRELYETKSQHSLHFTPPSTTYIQSQSLKPKFLVIIIYILYSTLSQRRLKARTILCWNTHILTE